MRFRRDETDTRGPCVSYCYANGCFSTSILLIINGKNYVFTMQHTEEYQTPNIIRKIYKQF